MIMFISKSMKVFVTLYEEQNIKNAAEKLCLTVPPVARMLNLTEQWLGEKLFTSERARLIPTSLSHELYQKIYPFYTSLIKINNKTRVDEFKISSPHSDSTIMAELLSLCHKYLPTHTSIKCVKQIHPDDDIYLCFQQIDSPAYFKQYNGELILELQCISSIFENWKNMPILTENYFSQMESMRKTMDTLSKQGHNGSLLRIDNSTMLQDAYKNGDGLQFTLPGSKSEHSRLLPHLCRIPIYVYINQMKKNSTHEKLLNKLSNIIQ